MTEDGARTTRPPSPRRATITDVAELAGVSRAAVSKVIRQAYGVSPRMEERVQAAISELGYRPRTTARSMRGRSGIIGVALPQFHGGFFSQVIAGVQDALTGTGYQVLVAPESSEARSSQTLRALSDLPVDGIIALSPGISPEQTEVTGTQVPLVVIGRHDDPSEYDAVYGDDELGAQQVMSHLLERGLKRVVHLTGDYVDPVGRPTEPHSVRQAVYERRMRAAGLPVTVLTSGMEPTFEEAAYRAMADYVAAAPWPDAVFAAHDDLALGALRAVLEHVDVTRPASPRCPTVVGYDNRPLASHPLVSLTTVDQNGPRMGREAARLLLERLSGRDDPTVVMLRPTLVERRDRAVPPLCDTAAPEGTASSQGPGAPATL